jgi:hypothetical protein
MHKNGTKCKKTQSKWCINKHGASKIIDTFETYQGPSRNPWAAATRDRPDISGRPKPRMPPRAKGRWHADGANPREGWWTRSPSPHTWSVRRRGTVAWWHGSTSPPLMHREFPWVKCIPSAVILCTWHWTGSVIGSIGMRGRERARWWYAMVFFGRRLGGWRICLWVHLI